MDAGSDSESDHPREEMMPPMVPAKPAAEPDKPTKAKGRGRPRKVRPEGSEGDAPKKQRGRPPGSGTAEGKKSGKR